MTALLPAPYRRSYEAFQRLRSPAMLPEASAAWDEAWAALKELMADHQTAMDAAAQAGAFCWAHDEWEHVQASGDAALIETAAQGVIATKAALKGVPDFMRGAGLPEKEPL